MPSEKWFDDLEDGNYLLSHVEDQEIIALPDSHDDMYIDILAEAFVKLRKAYMDLAYSTLQSHK